MKYVLVSRISLLAGLVFFLLSSGCATSSLIKQQKQDEIIYIHQNSVSQGELQRLSKKHDSEQDSDVNDNMDPNIFWRYFPLWVNPDLDPRVAQVAWYTYMLNAWVPTAGLWLPMAMLKDAPDLNGDIIASYSVPCLGAGLCGGSVFGLGIVLTPVMVGIPCLLIGPIMSAVMYYRMSVVASLNAWDRAYKERDSDHHARPKRSKKHKRKRMSDDEHEKKVKKKTKDKEKEKVKAKKKKRPHKKKAAPKPDNYNSEPYSY